MIYRRRIYKIAPERADAFNDFFNHHLLPFQLRYGAELVGRWISEDKTEIMAMWRYESKEHYRAIEEKIDRDPETPRVREIRKTLEPLFLESRQEFFTSTGDYG